jgi:uncharacterized protein (TIGR02284 family)
MGITQLREDPLMSMFDNHTNPADIAANESLDSLIDLHTSSVDTLRGFQKMAEKAEPSFRPVVEGFCAMHIRHAARLDTMVREMGGVPDADGSFMGTVNRAVVTLRATFDDIDADLMDNIRNGEETVLAAFDRAMQTSLPQGHVQALTQMRAELSAMLNETAHLG